MFANLHEILDRSVAPAEATECDVTRIYKENAAFVWASLQRLGVRSSDLEDVMQEVFVVVHRRVGSFDGTAKMTTWLFGISMRVAAAYRRRGFRRNETFLENPPETETESDASPEEELSRSESRRRLELLLDELELDRRAVFVMFEIDEVPCSEIAELVGVPLNTVYTRLHAARKEFQQALARMHARESHAMLSGRRR